ncbi:MAG: 4-hydroxy-tetrahydrodipicolinate synthase [Acidimicrobiia bacterium]|nr:4-hydroxy-tetrahydrodipicolinate synthase [Acidimicrobiia bacterium]
MSTPPFGSVLTAMITPFDSSGAVDYQAAWDLARYLTSHGNDGLVVCGTTGESPTLSTEEKLGMFRTVVEAVGDRAVVIAGTGTYDTAESVEMSKQAAELGCHGVMAVTPYYNKPPQEGLFRHFTAIADATDLPVLVYNIPGRTSRLIEVETLARLSHHDRIVATKDAVEDLEFTRRTLESVSETFAVYSGQDSFTLPMMEIGAVGIVSVAAHLVGDQIQAMTTAARDKEYDEARIIHDRLMPLFEALFLEPNPMPLKAVLSQLWQPVGDPRLPLIPPTAETVAAVMAALESAQAV